MSHSPQTDLDWLAFQYVNNELSVEEAERFEERLSEDQAAREAVAEAMLLCQAIFAGAKETIPAVSQRRSWFLHAGWAAVSAAACLALVFVLRSPLDRPAAPVAQRPSLSDLTSEELALVWVQSLVAPDTDIADEDDVNLVADSQEPIVAPWMLEALGGSEEAPAAAPERKET